MKISKFLKILPALALIFPFTAFPDYSSGIEEVAFSILTVEVKTSPTLNSNIFMNLGEMTNHAITPINCSGGEIGGMIFKPGESYTCSYKIEDIKLFDRGFSMWLVHSASKVAAPYRLDSTRLVPEQKQDAMVVQHKFNKNNRGIYITFQIDKK